MVLQLFNIEISFVKKKINIFLLPFSKIINFGRPDKWWQICDCFAQKYNSLHIISEVRYAKIIRSLGLTIIIRGLYMRYIANSTHTCVLQNYGDTISFKDQDQEDLWCCITSPVTVIPWYTGCSLNETTNERRVTGGGLEDRSLALDSEQKKSKVLRSIRRESCLSRHWAILYLVN